MVLVIAYLVLSINTYLETQALGVLRLGYGRLGPTEARLALIGLNTALALGAPLGFELLGIGMTALDVAPARRRRRRWRSRWRSRAAGTLRTLAEREPAARPAAAGR